MTEQNEPSMEDILASIRNILADGEGGTPPEPPKAEEPVPTPPAQPPQPPVQSQQPSPTPEAEEVMTLTPDMIVHEEPAEVAQPEPAPVKTALAPEDVEALISPPAAEATVASLSHLTQMFVSDRKPSVGGDGVTLEEIVRELMRPLLKEWLDKNLPEIVERVVKKEIARVMDRLDLK